MVTNRWICEVYSVKMIRNYVKKGPIGLKFYYFYITLLSLLLLAGLADLRSSNLLALAEGWDFICLLEILIKN